MADILIRGMEMPRCCALCDLEHWDEDSYGDEMNHRCCMYRKGYTAKVRETGRLPDCPLVPLPEGHGRLGDLDRLFEVLGQDADRWMVDEVSMIETDDVLYAIHNTPTIVPAEGGTE